MKATQTKTRSGVCRLTVAAGVAGFLVVSASGCYQRVVGAQGFGADSVGISKPNIESSRGDRTLGYPTYRPRSMPGG